LVNIYHEDMAAKRFLHMMAFDSHDVLLLFNTYS